MSVEEKMTDKAMEIAEAIYREKGWEVMDWASVQPERKTPEEIADIIRPLLPKPVESDAVLACNILYIKSDDPIADGEKAVPMIAAYREEIERKCGGKE